jgi:hypothetical protein
MSVNPTPQEREENGAPTIAAVHYAYRRAQGNTPSVAFTAVSPQLLRSAL